MIPPLKDDQQLCDDAEAEWAAAQFRANQLREKAGEVFGDLCPEGRKFHFEHTVENRHPPFRVGKDFVYCPACHRGRDSGLEGR